MNQASYGLASDLRWHHFEDGTVVYVGSTCETHALAPELAPLFGANGMLALGSTDESQVLGEQLSQLKILRPLN